MTEKPILFSGPMVRAILEFRKTKTRRVVKPQPKVVHALYPDSSIETDRIFRKGDQRIHAPYPRGTRLWVRETWAEFDGEPRVEYRADCDCWEYGLATIRRPELIVPRVIDRWRPSIFMPRRLSRINLLVTNVRCQRVQDITEPDAIAEGAAPWPHPIEQQMTSGEYGYVLPYRGGFACLWDDINADRGYTWYSNPWVWVYTFERILD